MSGLMGEDSGGLPPRRGVLGTIRGKRIFIRTFGCAYNLGDTRRLVEVLKHQRCTLAPDPDQADAAIVNTCIVTSATERKVLREIGALRQLPVFVTGCMASAPGYAIPSTLRQCLIHPDEIRAAYRRVGTIPREHVGIVQVCRGCRGSCTYCITRHARGPLVSEGRQEVLDEVMAIAEAGAAEIQLTGQDVSAWGMDSGSDLGALLAGINGIPGHFMARVGMMNPATLYPIASRVSEAYRGSRIFRFMHIPVQSGSDAVLGMMERGYTRDEVLEIVRRFREAVPDVTLHTDVICGYPGETWEDFQDTLSLLDLMQPDKVNVTRFSRRPGTPAAGKGDMPDRFKKERSRKLRSHAESIARAKNAHLLGREVEVIFTEHPRAGSSMGRTRNYTGVVVPGHYEPGTVRVVRLAEDRVYYFIGEPA